MGLYDLNYGKGNANPMSGFDAFLPPLQPLATSLPELPYIPSGVAPVADLTVKPDSFMSSLSSWMKSSGMLGSYDANTQTKTEGWGGMALGAGQALLNGYLGLQQLGVAKDALNFNKDQFYKNFAMQQKTINTRMEDRQRARVASNAGAYQSVGDYMQQNRV